MGSAEATGRSSGQRAKVQERAGREEDNTDAAEADGAGGRGGAGDHRGAKREELGQPGALKAAAAGRPGDPNPRGRGRRGSRGALTGVPPHGAAGGLLPQMREEEVPGGLEVLEVAELDNGASHGSGNPARAPTAPHHALPPETPRLPRPSPHCFSRAGAGKPNRKLSARSGPPSRSAAQARDGPGAGGGGRGGAGEVRVT